MKWQHKAAIQAVLSRMPLGHAIHRRLQDAAGTVRLNLDDHYVSKARFIRRGIDSGMPVRDRTLLDVGTGWHPIIPLFLHLLGAKRTITVDIHPWLTLDSLKDTFAFLYGASERIAEDFDLPAEEVKAKLGRLVELGREPSATIASLLDAASIDYRYPVNARDTKLPAVTIDGIFSFNVFEHIPYEDLVAILRESKRILTPGGTHLHHVGMGDHFEHGDKRITSVNFLRYSKGTWHWIGGSGLAYHNRLRGIDFVRMFEQEGFKLLDWEAKVDREALEALRQKKVVPHPDFAGYTHEELSGCVLNMIARYDAVDPAQKHQAAATAPR
jgi:SAM-dependent methyltransferase